jgi:hypothetical protein
MDKQVKDAGMEMEAVVELGTVTEETAGLRSNPESIMELTTGPVH